MSAKFEFTLLAVLSLIGLSLWLLGSLRLLP